MIQDKIEWYRQQAVGSREAADHHEKYANSLPKGRYPSLREGRYQHAARLRKFAAANERVADGLEKGEDVTALLMEVERYAGE